MKDCDHHHYLYVFAFPSSTLSDTWHERGDYIISFQSLQTAAAVFDDAEVWRTTACAVDASTRPAKNNVRQVTRGYHSNSLLVEPPKELHLHVETSDRGLRIKDQGVRLTAK